MAGIDTLAFNDAGFDNDVLKAPQPVLVDFWADWCMPCRTIGPVIDELATEYKGKIKVGKVDTDANQNTAVKFSVQSIPTIMLFKDGQVVKRWIGVTPKKDFKAAMDGLLVG